MTHEALITFAYQLARDNEEIRKRLDALESPQAQTERRVAGEMFRTIGAENARLHAALGSSNARLAAVAENDERKKEI